MLVESFQSDETKFIALILFLAQRSEGDHSFGATKLNKLLFYCDFLAYLKLGRPITGYRYQKLENGPAPRKMLPIIESMIQNKLIARVERDYYGHKQIRVLALQEPDLSCFTAEEISLATEILDDCRGNNATEISRLSHRFHGWQRASIGEDIPYCSASVVFQTVTESDLVFTESEKMEIRKIAEA